MGNSMYPILLNEGVRFEAIATGNDYFKPGCLFFDKPVYSISMLLDYYDKINIFIAFTDLPRYKEFLINCDKIEQIYTCDYRNIFFNKADSIEYTDIEKYADKFCKVYNSLCDDLSKKLY